MISAVKMPSGWYARIWPSCEDIRDVLIEEGENLDVHIENGNVVAFAEDIETLAYNLGISESEITIVEDEEE